MDGTTGAVAVDGERRRLVNVAYRLLGSATEAEDAVQDAYARWYGLPSGRREEIDSPGAWLTTVTGRICLDRLGSARARRERYVGVWLPEPLPDRTEWDHGGQGVLAAGSVGPARPTDPADQIVLDESVAMAFLVVLESMTPAERVALVLHDVFRYPFAQIADVLGRSPGACKQLAASARRRVGGAPAPAAAADRAEVVRHVKQAWERKDIAALVGLLDPGAVMTADGGGMVGAVLRPVEGGAHIARYMVAIADRAPGLELLERSVNGVPGLVARRDGVVLTVAAFDVEDGRVTRIWAIRNPEKLRRWARED
ncbi:RNA polymerase sigma factor SigJ [Streptomyces caniscabiei]|uniref:RNA polymerase sigma factor SigJ n=1 Tax=Streptomyces caniscabiei TaxID=2746961 RepID=A0A927L178_9ACTN|nr:RNA polymerase sigma factor SigJ [Streptomyces caniscabiei]MBD9724081.1 RNA polymerase sigma factor SigJ [Streptomyces caniscabiei]MDX3515804.1 RNA polymerase sigma factor SigJ [Streptomyces caniscabiei]MDX3718563.1 RNA polymerase sigma factor SigJ [Streptomyces caniscabiei]WEO22038.1 RNA polymerase sigma factor SigJ [Streptomyces caniscabiei]